MSEWQDIETARKDKVLVDLWIRSPLQFPKGMEWKAKYSDAGHRCTDCIYDASKDSWLREGTWITGRSFYKDGDQHFDPSDKSDEASVATHWMPLPIPPPVKQEAAE